jgi:hypothetical protein
MKKGPAGEPGLFSCEQIENSCEETIASGGTRDMFPLPH